MPTTVTEENQPLEDTVNLHHEVVLLANEGFEERGSHLAVVVAGQGVANVVQKSTNDVLFVLSIFLGKLSRLDAMCQTVDRESTEVSVQQAQVRQNPVRKSSRERSAVLL